MVERKDRTEGTPLSGFILSEQARDDVAEISDFLEDNADEAVARRFVDSFAEACRLLAEKPGIGCPRPGLGLGIRVHLLGSYVILYRDTPDLIVVVRVLHERRDISRIFGVHEDEERDR